MQHALHRRAAWLAEDCCHRNASAEHVAATAHGQWPRPAARATLFCVRANLPERIRAMPTRYVMVMPVFSCIGLLYPTDMPSNVKLCARRPQYSGCSIFKWTSETNGKLHIEPYLYSMQLTLSQVSVHELVCCWYGRMP